jgi:hypothetical protein
MAASQEPRELVLDISNTLTGPWSASSVAGMLTQESVSYLARREKWDAMEPLVRAKLVLSPLFLRKGDLDAMHDSLMEIQSVACQDKNEWVHMLSSAVDGYDGRLHTDKVLEEMPRVKDTVDAVVDLSAAIDPSIYRPLEEKYLSDRVLDQLGCLGFSMDRQGDCKKPAVHSHFIVRDPDVHQKVQNSTPASDSVKLSLGAGSNGFSQPMKQRKTPAEIQKTGLGLGQRAGVQASVSSLFMKPSRGKVVGRVGSGARVAPVKKKAAILDISAIQQARAVNEQRRQDLKKQKEEEKEIEAKEKAEAVEAEKKAREERKQILKEQEKRKKDLMKQKAKEEKKKALDEAKALKDEERKKKREMNNQLSAGSSKKHKAANVPLDPQDVTAALGKARLKADLESTKDIENHKAFENA